MSRTQGAEPPIGTALRELRTSRGLTQEELAARSGLHRNYIGGVERGERNPTFRSVGKILRVLGVSWADLGRRLDALKDRR
ncbi:MAG: helix-turn-helix transcriptional regulator [Gemmatimonadetes bacterium]|nr:helix-turn-helix transcriptional regulator [Gemmatimonadota bacterium]